MERASVIGSCSVPRHSTAHYALWWLALQSMDALATRQPDGRCMATSYIVG
jgi:hypothetical protein